MMMLCRPLGLCFFILLHSQVTILAMAQTIGTQSPLQGQSSRIVFSKSMIYIIAILIFIFFVLGFISVYTRRCVESRLRAHLSYRSFPFGDSGRRGLPSLVVNTFPTFVYSAVKGLKIGKGSLECAVCLNAFEEDETLRLIPICNHVFHSQCIDVWLGSHSTCPVCRADLNPDTGSDKASLAITIQGTDNDPTESDRRSGSDHHETPHEVTVGSTSSFPRGNNENQNRLPSSRSTGFRFSSLFGLSHSTGQSQSSTVHLPSEDDERFTLRLPEEARDHLVNPSLKRAQSCVTLAGESCSRKGYRSEDESEGARKDLHYNQFGQEEREENLWFTMASTFFNRPGWRETGHETHF